MNAVDYLAQAIQKYWKMAVIVGGTVGLYYESKSARAELFARLASLEEKQAATNAALSVMADTERARHAFGPGGFLDNAIRTGLEAHFREYLDTRGYPSREWIENFFKFNPSLQRPAGK